MSRLNTSLLMLTMEDSARRIFESLSVDISSLQKEVKEYINKNVPKTKESKEIQPTLAFQRVLQRAIFHVQSSGKTEVHGENLLAAIFSEKESYAVYILNRRNISRLDVVEIFPMEETLPLKQKKAQRKLKKLLNLTQIS